jgi:hypothetical protein
MKYCKLLLISSLIALIFGSCKDDFSLNAPYKDITIVYGLLNPNDSIQYIKVYKGFQSEDNSIVAAADWNNLYYFDKITVTIEEFLNGVSTNRIITLDTTTSVPRESGSIANSKQLLYCTKETLNPNASYQIKIVNKETGRVVTGNTDLISLINITAPNIPTNNGLNLIGKKANIIFSHNENAYGYEIYEYFYYFEVSKLNGDITKYGVVKRDITNQTMLTQKNVNNGEVNKEYSPNSIYDIIALQVQSDPTVDRYKMGTSCISFQVWGASKSLYNYLIVNKPSSSIVQEHLEYTNMVCPTDESYKTAYGIIGARYNAVKKYNITSASEDSLVKGSKTSNLGFKYYRDYIPR